jgi:hypothetical protein
MEMDLNENDFIPLGGDAMEIDDSDLKHRLDVIYQELEQLEAYAREKCMYE